MQAPSNSIVVDGAVLSVPAHLVAAGLRVKNWFADEGVQAFRARPRRRDPRHVVLRESAGGINAAATIAGLARRGLGVHLCVPPDGIVTCHADLARDVLIHAQQCNKTGVGIEEINPYYARGARPPFTATVPAEWWTHVPKGEPALYLLPTPQQDRARLLLVPWVCSLLGIDYQFPTANLGPKRPRILGWKLRRRPDAGVIAHRDIAGHADGRWPLEQIMRAAGVAADK